ncbi:MAG: YqeG family HAD IIIA-type phosphatase [Oscillospiraceae bacterium]|nr:YqeG family HAD IIIA-type phosphatase [Oscillospiraceae bacterium]
MSYSFRAKYAFRRLTDIPCEFLRERGLRLLLLDLDNTIAPYKTPEPDGEAVRWAETLKAGGVALFILSNSKHPDRVERFAGRLGVDWVYKAKKPSPRGVLAAARQMGFSPEETALVGDQTFTDVWGANRAGVTSILVRPIKFENPLHAVRYILELPFRAACKEKIEK